MLGMDVFTTMNTMFSSSSSSTPSSFYRRYCYYSLSYSFS
jgi:hypothetical protein